MLSYSKSSTGELWQSIIRLSAFQRLDYIECQHWMKLSVFAEIPILPVRLTACTNALTYEILFHLSTWLTDFDPLTEHWLGRSLVKLIPFLISGSDLFYVGAFPSLLHLYIKHIYTALWLLCMASESSTTAMPRSSGCNFVVENKQTRTVTWLLASPVWWGLHSTP